MDIRKLQRVIVDALEDVKGQDIKVFNTVGITQLFDRVVIASGTSNRQTKALAASVRDKVKSSGGDVISMEGEETGEWVLVDVGDAIVHIMQPTIRTYYNLEEIWGGKPVSVKSDDAPAAPGAGGEPAGKVTKKVAKKAAGKTATKTAAKTGLSSPPARKAASKTARKVPAKAPSKTARSRSDASKSAPAKAARKTAAKKTAR